MVFGGEKSSSKYREIVKVHIDPEAKPTYVIRWLKGGAAEYPSEKGIFHPEGVAAVEDFLPGETSFWTFFHSEFHYVLKGQCEITYLLAPWYDEEKKFIAEPGDAYLLPLGSNVTFKVISSEPFRHLCVIMPRQMLYGEVKPKNIVPL